MSDTLFDNEGPTWAKYLARKGDPVTSKEAAEHMVSSGAITEMQFRVLEAVQDHPGLCSNELEAVYGFQDGRFRKRLAELERAGKVRRGEERKSRVSGRRCATWWPAGASK